MAEPFLGEIRLMSFNYPPRNWAFCNGQFLPINQNQALFSLLGTTYGGNGQTTFQLPDLRGRVPLHEGLSVFGESYALGQRGGAVSHTLSMAEMPEHTHQLQASSRLGDAQNATTGRILAAEPGSPYAPSLSPGGVALAPATVSNIGGSQPHENRQPFLALSFCIALNGIFPSQN